jgi:hypothetical protein
MTILADVPQFAALLFSGLRRLTAEDFSVNSDSSMVHQRSVIGRLLQGPSIEFRGKRERPLCSRTTVLVAWNLIPFVPIVYREC